MTQLVTIANVSLEAASREPAGDMAALVGGVITIGNFDGVHRGHAALLRQVRITADRIGGPAVAVVLDPHPALILRPEMAPKRLTWVEQRADLMASHGIDFLVVCSTTRSLLNLTAEAFFGELVVNRLQAQAIVEGPNFYFGRNRGGNAETLRKLCDERGIELHIIAPNQQGERMVSSTRIRELLERGEIEQANELLGHPFQIRGQVVHGARRGREIGFPTANLSEIDVLIPAPGVYGGRVRDDEGQHHVAAIHIGPNPTFDCDGDLKVEVHLLDFNRQLYGETLLVDVMIRVRDIARFDSVEALVAQLNQDIEFIRTRLAPLRRSQG